jgi:hypothetical protein
MIDYQALRRSYVWKGSKHKFRSDKAPSVEWNLAMAKAARLLGLQSIHSRIITAPTLVQVADVYSFKGDAAVTKLEELTLDYNIENTAYYDLLHEALDFSGPYKDLDTSTIARDLHMGEFCDGMGLREKMERHHDSTTLTAQGKLQVKLTTTKMPDGLAVADMAMFMHDMLSTWLLVKGNTIEEPGGFVQLLLLSFPTLPDTSKTVLVRQYYAGMVHKNDSICAQPYDLIEALCEYGATLGIPDQRAGPGPAVLPVVGDGGGGDGKGKKGKKPTGDKPKQRASEWTRSSRLATASPRQRR